MADHTARGEPALPAAEPASVSEIARLIVAALVALGVFELDDTTWNTITLIIGGLISIGLTAWTRRKVTPKAKPRTDEGVPLVPSPPEKTLGEPPTPPPPPPTTS